MEYPRTLSDCNTQKELTLLSCVPVVEDDDDRAAWSEQFGQDFTTRPRRRTVASGDSGFKTSDALAAGQHRHRRAKEAPPVASTGQSRRTCLRSSRAQRRQLPCESARTRPLETTQIWRDAHPGAKASA